MVKAECPKNYSQGSVTSPLKEEKKDVNINDNRFIKKKVFFNLSLAYYTTIPISNIIDGKGNGKETLMEAANWQTKSLIRWSVSSVAGKVECIIIVD